MGPEWDDEFEHFGVGKLRSSLENHKVQQLAMNVQFLRMDRIANCCEFRFQAHSDCDDLCALAGEHFAEWLHGFSHGDL